jgi:hypothetical protein
MNTNNMAIFQNFGLDSSYGKSLKELDFNTFNFSYSFLAMPTQYPKKKCWATPAASSPFFCWLYVAKKRY